MKIGSKRELHLNASIVHGFRDQGKLTARSGCGSLCLASICKL